MTGAIQAVTWLFFFFFCSAEIQPWNYSKNSDQEKGDKTMEGKGMVEEKEEKEQMEKEKFILSS